MDPNSTISSSSSVSVASSQVSVLPYFIHRIASLLPISSGYSIKEVEDEPTFVLSKDTLKELATHGLLAEIFPSILALTKDLYKVCSTHSLFNIRCFFFFSKPV